MKKISKFICSLAAVAFVAVSCDVSQLGETDTYTPGTPDVEGCYGVFIPTQDFSAYATLDPKDPTVVPVKVGRAVAKGAITISAEVICEDSCVFTATPIVFEDGQEETTFEVNFPNAEIGKTYTCTVQVTDPQYVSKYSSKPSFATFSITRVKWVLLGNTGRWRDDIVASAFGAATFPEVDNVAVYEREDKPGYYKFINPYGPEMTAKIFIALGYPVTPEDVKGNCTDREVIVDATNPEKVYIPEQPLGTTLSSSYGECYVLTLCDACGFEGYSNYGTLVNKVITFPVKGLLTPYEKVYKYYYGNNSGMTRICLPGAVLTDYSLSVEAGLTEDGILPIQFTTGDDVDKVLYAAYVGELTDKELDEKKADIAAGKETAAKELDLETGAVDFSADSSCVYTLAAVAFDRNGARQNDTDVTFGYVKKGDEEETAVQAGCSLETLPESYKFAGYKESSCLLFNVYGKDIESGKIGMFTQEDYDADTLGLFWDMLYDFDDDEIETINSVGGYTAVWSGLKANTEYVMLVSLFNGYQEANYVMHCATPGLPREKVAEGKYSYSFFWTGSSNYDLMYDPNTELYVIENWGAGVDFTFAWDKETNLCPVQLTDIGTTYSSYGEVYCVDASKYWEGYEAYAKANGYDPTPSYYVADTTTFNFNLEYIVAAGTFGDRWETFELTPASKTSIGPLKDSKEAAYYANNLKLCNFKSNVKVPFRLAKPYTEVEGGRTVKAANCTFTKAERRLMSNSAAKAADGTIVMAEGRQICDVLKSDSVTAAE